MPLDPQTRSALATTLADFMEDYARVIDRNELERWPEFFEVKCTYKVTTRDNEEAGYPIGVMYAGSRAMLQDRVMALRDANIYEDQRYHHLVGRPYVVQVDGEMVRAETSFLVIRTMLDGAMTVFAAGSYHDLLRVTPEGIHIAERIVVCDSARVDTLMALPL